MEQWSDYTAHRALESVGNLLDGGELRVYGGEPRPEGEDPENQRLATVRFNSPAFQVPQSRSMVSFPLMADARAKGEGPAAWFRCVARDGVVILQGAVGVVGSGADLELDRVYIQRGSFFAIETFTVML